jgi:hypothetical protein
MDKIKKYLLYLDDKKEPSFQKKNISMDEEKEINNFFLLQKNNMRNPRKLPYIQLLKVINSLRVGSVYIFSKKIYFLEKDAKIAKKMIISDFKNKIGRRSKESLQNLKYITEENLKFIEELAEVTKVKKEVASKKGGKSHGKKTNKS